MNARRWTLVVDGHALLIQDPHPVERRIDLVCVKLVPPYSTSIHVFTGRSAVAPVKEVPPVGAWVLGWVHVDSLVGAPPWFERCDHRIETREIEEQRLWWG